MKKYKGVILKIIPIVLVFVLIGTSVFGVDASFDKVRGVDSAGLNTVKGATNTIWATVAFIAQFLSVAAVVFAGLRYMLASADTKADIKKQMVILILGAAMVFGAATIVQLVGKTAVEVLPSSGTSSVQD